MGRYLLRRLPSAIAVLFAASVLIFAILRVVPGDPASTLAGPDATPETIAAIRHDLGLDQPVITQYLSWLGHVLTFDLGRSYLIGGQIADLVTAPIRPAASAAARQTNNAATSSSVDQLIAFASGSGFLRANRDTATTAIAPQRNVGRPSCQPFAEASSSTPTTGAKAKSTSLPSRLNCAGGGVEATALCSSLRNTKRSTAKVAATESSDGSAKAASHCPSAGRSRAPLTHRLPARNRMVRCSTTGNPSPSVTSSSTALTSDSHSSPRPVSVLPNRSGPRLVRPITCRSNSATYHKLISEVPRLNSTKAPMATHASRWNSIRSAGVGPAPLRRATAAWIAGIATQISVHRPAMISCLLPVALTASTTFLSSQVLIKVRSITSCSGNTSVICGKIRPPRSATTLVRIVGTPKTFAAFASAVELLTTMCGS